jgi:hypothetical protein
MNPQGFPWKPLPSGYHPPEEASPVERDPHANTPISVGNKTWEISGRSPEKIIEKLESTLKEKPFQVRGNGEDFVLAISPLEHQSKFKRLFKGQIQATFCFTAYLDDQEIRLSELPEDAQEALHHGEGGFHVILDYVTKRPFLTFALSFLVSSLLSAMIVFTLFNLNLSASLFLWFAITLFFAIFEWSISKGWWYRSALHTAESVFQEDDS